MGFIVTFVSSEWAVGRRKVRRSDVFDEFNSLALYVWKSILVESL